MFLNLGFGYFVMVEYQCCILANPKGNSWDFSKNVYNIIKNKEKGKKFQLVPVLINKFRDGEIYLKVKDNVRRRNCYFIHDSSKEPSEWFNELVFVNHTLRNSSCQEITDVLPYLRYSRQDRKDESRVPISARIVADMIGNNANRVLTLDVHNPSIQGFYRIPFDYLYSFPIVIKHFKKRHGDFLENVVIMSPDAGGSKRAEAFARRLNVGNIDIAVGYKTRKNVGDVDDLKIAGDVKGKNVLIVDDIVDSGNSMIKAREAIVKEGVKGVAAYCTHALFTGGVERVMEYFDFFVIGDTIANPSFNNKEKLEVVSFVPLFAEAIYRINEGESLSGLLEEAVEQDF